jgi:hypothetical protein
LDRLPFEEESLLVEPESLPAEPESLPVEEESLPLEEESLLSSRKAFRLNRKAFRSRRKAFRQRGRGLVEAKKGGVAEATPRGFREGSVGYEVAGWAGVSLSAFVGFSRLPSGPTRTIRGRLRNGCSPNSASFSARLP